MLLLPLLACTFVAPQDDATLDMFDIELSLRGGGEVTVQRGELRVPIVREDPDSRLISVDVWRFPAVEGADPETPPVFRLHGGPGWPGMEPEDIDYEGDILPMLRVSDLVVVGQRGIGTSLPNTYCGVPQLPEGELTQEQEDALLVEACRNCRKYWESEGYDLKGLNVLEAAADIDDIARLLGYEKITLWGGSFGSHWGMATMRRFPERIARAVLTGMEGPDHTYDAPSGVLASLERLAESAEYSPRLKGKLPEEGLIAAFRGVIERLEEKPAEVQVGDEVVVIEADDVRDVALGMRGRTSSRRGARTWPADIVELHAGRFENLARRKLADSGPSGLPTASFFMLDCGSGITAERLEKLKADPAAFVVGDLGHFYETACQAWDSDLGDEFRTGFYTEIPTLIVHGTWDTSTPLDNAIELLPSFENNTFVMIEGGSHGALNEAMRYSASFRGAVMEFVRSGATEDLPLDVVMPDLDWDLPRSN